MLTYFNVVLSQSEIWLGKQASTAGIMYFHVHNPLIAHAYKITDDQVEQQILIEFKMKGLITAEESVAQLMDVNVETGRSDIAPFGFKKDGTFYAVSKVANEKRFTVLQQHMHRLIESAGLQIL